LGIVDSTRTLKGVPFSKDISLKLPSVASFLEACAVSFEENDKLNALFDAVSNGNARDTLTYVQNVITSLHLDTDKILDKIESGGYTMPDHEALRALLFGDSMHYDPEKSVFINLFDISRADPCEHFTRLLILRHLGAVSKGYPAYGFLSTEETKRYMCQLGYSDGHVMETLAFLFGKGCIEAKLPVDSWTQDMTDIRITDRGSYMVGGLVWQFNYIDAIIVDTSIIKPEYKAKIQDVTDIVQRLNRCLLFLDYLDECCKLIQDNSVTEFWSSISTSVRKRAADIRRDVEDQKRRRTRGRWGKRGR